MPGTCTSSGGLQLQVTREIQSRVSVFLAQSWASHHTISLTTLTNISPKYRVTNCWNTSKFGTEKSQQDGWLNSTLQSPPLAIPWQNPKTDSRLNMWVRNSWTKTHSHLTLETVKLLNHMNMNLLKHNNTPWLLYAEKHEMHEAWCDQAKVELRNKPNNHYKVVTTMLIHTWNEHLDIQANKNNANHFYAQYSTNA